MPIKVQKHLSKKDRARNIARNWATYQLLHPEFAEIQAPPKDRRIH